MANTKSKTAGAGIGGAEPAMTPRVPAVAGTKILLCKSGVKDKKPDPAGAEYGEVFVNYHSGSPMLCFKDNAGEIVEIKPTRNIDGGGGETPPSTGNEIGDTLWDGTHFRVWDGSTWVAVGPNDLAYVQKVDGGTITNSAGSDVDIPVVNNIQAGLMLPGDKNKLDTYPADSADLEVDLGYTPAADKGTVTNSNGDDAEIPLATGTNAGLMAPGDKNKIDGYPATPGDLATTLDLQAVTDNGNTTTNGAQFVGDPRDSAGVEAGFYINTGAVNARIISSANDTSPVFSGKEVGSTGYTSAIFGNGSASFGSDNITLNANGSATFASNVQVGDDASGALNSGLFLNASGRVTAVSTPGNNLLWSGYLTGNTNTTSQIKADGSASFGSDNITLNADGSASFAGNLKIQDATIEAAFSYTNLKTDGIGFWSPDNWFFGPDVSTPASAVISLNATDGSASFGAGQIQFGTTGTATFDGGLTSKTQIFANISNAKAPNPANYRWLIQELEGVAKVEMWANGKAAFAGTVTGNSFAPGIQQNAPAFIANAASTAENHAAYYTRQYTAGGYTLAGADSLGAINFSVKDDGTIKGTNVFFNLEPDNPANYEVTTEQYTETETYTVEVPVLKPQTGTADLVDEDPEQEREMQTITKEREVTKEREIRTYVGPVLDVKERLLKTEAALMGLKEAVTTANTCDDLKAAIVSALAVL